MRGLVRRDDNDDRPVLDLSPRSSPFFADVLVTWWTSGVDHEDRDEDEDLYIADDNDIYVGDE